MQLYVDITETTLFMALKAATGEHGLLFVKETLKKESSSQFGCARLIELWVELALVRGHFVLMGIICGQKTWPLYGVKGWPQVRGFLSTILYGHAVRTKVSGRYR